MQPLALYKFEFIPSGVIILVHWLIFGINKIETKFLDPPRYSGPLQNLMGSSLTNATFCH